VERRKKFANRQRPAAHFVLRFVSCLHSLTTGLRRKEGWRPSSGSYFTGQVVVVGNC
jgi:hypothetical protein